MTADEFRSRMDDDVGTVVERTEEVRCGKGVVDDDRQAVSWAMAAMASKSGILMAGLPRLSSRWLGLVVDVFGKGLRVVGIGEVRRNAEVFEGFRKQFDRAAVQGRSGDDFIAGAGQVDDGVGDSRCAAGRSKTGRAVFKGGDSFFQDVLGRIGQTAVDEAGSLNAKRSSACCVSLKT